MAASREVMVVFHESTVGGASQSVIRAMPLLRDRGWAFSCWAPRPSELFDRLEAAGYEVAGAPRHIDFGLTSLLEDPGPARRVGSLRPYLRSFEDFLRRRAPALVHANSVTAVVEGAVAASRGFPALLHSHELVPRGLRGRLIRRVAWTRLERVVAVSRASAETLRRGGREPDVVYEAAPVPSVAVSIRARPSPFRIGTVGEVSRRKGTDVFVAAAERAMAGNDRLSFTIVGAPRRPREARWARGVIAGAVANGIEYAGQADVMPRLRSWDAFALASRSDPCPIALLEAMAAGLPVVGAQVDGIREQIAPGAGILVRPEDPDALAEAFLRLAELDGDAREELGAAARSRVAERFSLERQAAGLDRVYREATGISR